MDVLVSTIGTTIWSTRQKCCNQKYIYHFYFKEREITMLT